MPWYLVANSGPMAGSAFRLLNDTVSVGRDSDNEVVVDDQLVSRHHARLERQDESYALVDLNSTNGSWVNGQRVTGSMPLHYGDTLALGTKSTFVFSNEPFVEDVTVMAPRGAVPTASSGHPTGLPAASPSPQSQVLVCPACGTANPPGTRFCGHCGGSLTPEREIVCAACGVLNQPGRHYCGNCGQPLAVQRPGIQNSGSVRKGGTTSLLLLAVGALFVLLTLTIAGLGLILLLNVGGVRDNLSSTASAPERALALADEYVAAHHGQFVDADRQLAPTTRDGRRVFTVTYSRRTEDGNEETLWLVVDPQSWQVMEISP